MVSGGQQMVSGGQQMVSGGQQMVSGGQQMVSGGQKIVSGGHDFVVSTYLYDNDHKTKYKAQSTCTYNLAPCGIRELSLHVSTSLARGM